MTILYKTHITDKPLRTRSECPYDCNTNVSSIYVGDGFSAKTATLLSLCDISPNRQCRQLKKIRKNNAQIRQQKLVQKAN